MNASQQAIPQWREPAPVLIPDALREAIPGPDLLLQTLVRRGFSDPQKARAFLFTAEYAPASALELPGLEKAIHRLKIALEKHEKIGIWGDFDVDGQTSTAILVGGLRKLGAEVVYHVPIRETESHGILLDPLKTFMQTGITLLVTCDTGISAHDPIAFAMKSGLDVIITDHHTLPEILPDALAIVNPQLVDADHPLRTLSGSGIAYKVMEQLFIEHGNPALAEEWLDLAALGLVADLATLTGDARYLVQLGLQRIRSHPRTAFARIFSDNDILPEQVNEETISFVLAPRMNAVGRLSDANPMVEFLLSADPLFIATTVNLVEGLNSQRKILCDQVFRGALAQLEQNPRLLDFSLLLLTHPNWPGGVVGIVASRLVELFHRPAILMNLSEGMARGSARSVEGVNITRALTENKSLLTSFGGHPMAAGMAISEENVDALRRGLSRSIDRMIESGFVEPAVQMDAVINLQEIDLDLIAALEPLAPFGPGNPPLQFLAKDLELIDAIPFGKTGEHLQMMVQSTENQQYKVVWWQGVELPRPENRFDLLYKAQINRYKGKMEVRFEWVDFCETAQESESSARKRRKKQLVNLDFRQSTNPVVDLEQIMSAQSALVWSEGQADCPVPAVNRTSLTPSNTLILWVPPASPKILQQIFETVKPQKVYWFANLPQENELKKLVTMGSLLCKKRLQGPGHEPFPLQALSAELSVPDEITRCLLLGLQARGFISFAEYPVGTIQLAPGTGKVYPDESRKNQEILMSLHQEMTAYRQLYLRASPVSQLLPDTYKPE